MEKDLQTLGKDQRMAEWVHLIENIVFLELLRRGNKVNIGKLGGNEVNFITRGSTGTVLLSGRVLRALRVYSAARTGAFTAHSG